MKQLINLIKNNIDKPRKVAIDNESNTIWIYDIIGADVFGGIDALKTVKAINGMQGEEITLRINSPGGDVFAGRAIATALKGHKAKVTAYVDGVAASAATTILMAADEIIMADGSFIMVHNAMTFVYGNKEEMLETAALLEKIDDAIAQDYAERTGESLEEVKAWMRDETWFNADEAVTFKMADKNKKEEKYKNSISDWDLSAYANAPKPESKKELNFEAEQLRLKLESRLRLLERCPA
jgi:ATP-dependent Clp protease, protease subunit